MTVCTQLNAKGKTLFLQKNWSKGNYNNYRSMAYFSLACKLITGILADNI